MNNLRKQIVLILGIAFLLFSFVQLEAQENKKAEKAGIKVKKSAANMEKVEIKESVKAYNKLVDQFNKIENDNKSTDAADQINQHIDSTTDEIASILSSVCK